jgi:hypothetical protein
MPSILEASLEAAPLQASTRQPSPDSWLLAPDSWLLFFAALELLSPSSHIGRRK